MIFPRLPEFTDQLQLLAVLDQNSARTNWAELVGTAITALIAAAVGAYATGHVTRRANDAQYKKHQYELDVSAAFAMQQKIVRIYSSVTSIRGDLAAARLRKQVMKSPFLALNFRPFANEPSDVKFSTEELERIHRIGGNELLNLVADLDLRYNAVMRSLIVYRERWINLTDGWDGFVNDNGLLSTARTMEEIRKDAPRLYLLDDIANQASILLDELVHIAFAALVDLYMARGQKLGLKQRLETVTPDGAKISVQSISFDKSRKKSKPLTLRIFKREQKLKGLSLYGPERINAPKQAEA